MKQKRRGFTLIELLAVIVILAIIALIAVPVIMNIISSARKSAFEDTAYGLIDAGEMYYASALLNDGMTGDMEFTIIDGEFVGTNKLEVSGELPENGKITVTKDGRVAIAVNNGAHCVTKATSESKIKTDDYTGECNYSKVLNPIITTTAECLKDVTKTCTSAEINTNEGVSVQVKVNDKETKTFYVVKDDVENNSLTLIMDSNLGESVTWINKKDYLALGGTEEEWGERGNSNKGPITALNYLESQTANWNNISAKSYTLKDDETTPKYEIERTGARARMITYTEASSVGCVKFESSCPEWLYANSTSGLWLSTSAGVGAWSIDLGGIVNAAMASDTGVRPVIEIPKTII